MPGQMPGLVRALVCNAPGLPNGEVYAFQMNSSDNFQLSWANFNRWWGFDVSQAGRRAVRRRRQPARGAQLLEAATSRRGRARFSSARPYPPVTVAADPAPAYAWALPSEDAFFVAQGADGSSFTALNSWWTTNVTAGASITAGASAGIMTSPAPARRNCRERFRGKRF